MATQAIPYSIEKMTLADVPAVTTLEQLVFALPWSAHAFEYEVRNNPMAHFFVVRPRPSATAGLNPAVSTPGPLIGYGGLWLIIDEGHICTLAVHPNWRGQGLGEFLLMALIERCIALNATVATLEVRASNVVAQSLYRKYGFARVGARKGYYADNHEDAWIMTTDALVTAAYQTRFQALKMALLDGLAHAS